MNCLEFERLLDTGELSHLGEDALAHVRDCAHCARSLARARSLERQLERAFSAEHGAPVTGSAAGDALPASFTDRVMARVERGEARGVRWLVLPDALPWWVRAAAEPSVALSCALTALLLWKGDALITAARNGLPSALAAPAQLAASLEGSALVAWAQTLDRALVPGPQAHWSVIVAMGIGTAPVFGLLGWLMWRLGERIALPTGRFARR